VYDAEVLAIDDALRVMFEKSGLREFLANAVVVITADHGEAFGSHRLFGHGGSLYNELIHVPLLVIPPGQTRRIDVDDVVQLIDVAPTLLKRARIPVPSRFEGRPLPGEPAGAADWIAKPWRWLTSWRTPPSAYSELFLPNDEDKGPPHHERAIVVGSRKLVVRNDDAIEFYDLARDPTESAADQVPERERDDIRRLFARVKRSRPEGASQPSPKVDEETRAKLRALGYTD